MQLYPLKLVTVVGESIVMHDSAKRGLKLGASGYTLAEVIGEGSRSARNVGVSGEAKTMKLEFIVPMDVAVKISLYVSTDYFEHYAIMAWMSDVHVVRGQSYYPDSK